MSSWPDVGLVGIQCQSVMETPVALKEMIVIENAVLSALAANAAALKEFPFLGSLRQARGCGGCGRKAKTQATDPFAAAKMAIFGLPDAKKRRLKELLGARQIRLIFTPKGAKVPVKLTIS